MKRVGEGVDPDEIRIEHKELKAREHNSVGRPAVLYLSERKTRKVAELESPTQPVRVPH